MRAELIVVCEPTDQLGRAFTDYALAEGALCERMTIQAFARSVSIEHAGGVASVEPACALLLRPPAGVGAMAAPDDRFTWAECFAAAWSAATLTPAPVVNRPGAFGWSGELPVSPALLDARLGAPPDRREVYWRGDRPTEAGHWLHQELVGWATVDDPDGATPIRSRRFPACRGWDQVIVVAGRGLQVTTTDHAPHDLEADSAAIAAALDLNFATVSWGVPEDGGPPVLARVNAFPGWYECAPVWSEVRAGLLQALSP